MLFIPMEPIFDHDKLDVYALELQFVTWTTDFLDEVSQSPVSRRRELVDQLDRASISVLLNTAEGNGKRQGPQRARYFDDARGSALECAACLDASVAKRITKSDRICPGKELLARIVAMLTRLVERSIQTNSGFAKMESTNDRLRARAGARARAGKRRSLFRNSL